MVLANVAPAQTRCREISAADIDRIVSLLDRAFPHPSGHWVHALKRLSEHSTPTGFPKYGYLLECNDTPVGVILLIYSSIPVNGQIRIRCNICSWYVEPAFRSYAAMLASHVRGHKDVTYVNVSAAPHTWPILEASGYVRYCSGLFAAIPALGARSYDARVKVIGPDICRDADLEPAELKLLLAHANYGCITLTCSSVNGTYPFVFMRRKYGLLPFAYLMYCRDLEDFVRFARPLGRFLAGCGIPVVLLDSNGPVPGLIGKYFNGYAKYFKGPDQPRLGDLAYTEVAMLSIPGKRIGNRRPRHSLHTDITVKT
jgi:hypothetical protein